MSSKSENKEAAAKLIDFLINNEEANKLMKAERGMPASDKVRAAMEPDFNDNQKKVLAITDEAVQYSSANDAPAMEGSSDIQNLIDEYEERIMYKDDDARRSIRCNCGSGENRLGMESRAGADQKSPRF